MGQRSNLASRLRQVDGEAAATIAGAWFASRLMVVLSALAAESLLPRNPELTSAASGPVLSSLTTWDSGWYLEIARAGYHAAAINGQHDYAFFPLYPALIRLFSLATPSFDGLVAVAIANVLFLVAVWLLYQLTRTVFDDDLAVRSCVYLTVFPFAWVFSMAYTESLFLVVSLGSLLAAQRRHPGWAAVLAAAAGLTRVQGVLLIVPLAIMAWQSGTRRRNLLRLPLVGIGPLAFLAFVTLSTGNPDAYGAAQASWSTSSPLGTAVRIQSMDSSFVTVTLLAALLGFVFLLVYLRPDKIPLPYAALAVVSLGVMLGPAGSTGPGASAWWRFRSYGSSPADEARRSAGLGLP